MMPSSDERRYYSGSDFRSSWKVKSDPRFMSLMTLLSGGLPPDPSKPFTYVDFGCGQAANLILLAQLYPDSEFIGFDIRSSHIEWGRNWAASLGLRNVRLENLPFSEIQCRDLPVVDYATAFGIMSWVSDADISSLLAKVTDSLHASCGVFQFTANMTAGLGALTPIRNMLKMLSESDQLDSEALSFLLNVTPNADDGNPSGLYRFLRRFSSEDLEAVRHEFCGDVWRLFLTTELAALMVDYDLRLIGPRLSRIALMPPNERPLNFEDDVSWEDLFDYRSQAAFRGFLCQKLGVYHHTDILPDWLGTLQLIRSPMLSMVASDKQLAKLPLHGPLEEQMSTTESREVLKQSLEREALVITTATQQKTPAPIKLEIAADICDQLEASQFSTAPLPNIVSKVLGTPVPVPKAVIKRLRQLAGRPFFADEVNSVALIGASRESGGGPDTSVADYCYRYWLCHAAH